MKDITAPQHLEITIREDGKVVWLNTELLCVFRACQIGEITVVDLRESKESAA